MKTLYIEGTDLIGKTTLVEELKDQIDVRDRYIELTQKINKDGSLKPEKEILEVVDKLKEDEKILILYTTNNELLENRLQNRIDSEYEVDEFDKNCVLYNYSYVELTKILFRNEKIIILCIDGMNKEDIKEFILNKMEK